MPCRYLGPQALLEGRLPNLDDALPVFGRDEKGLATRQHSQTMLNTIAPKLPGLIGRLIDAPN